MGKRGKVIVIYDVEIGRIIAKEILNRREEISIISRAREGNNALVKDILKMKGKFLLFTIDPLDPMAIEKASIETEKRLGPIDIWFNPPINKVPALNTKESQLIIENTLSLQVFGVLSALRRMLPKNKGSIIFIGAEILYSGNPFSTYYKGQNKAIIGFYKLIKAELLRDNSKVKVNWINSVPSILDLDLYNNLSNANLKELTTVNLAQLAVHLNEYIDKDSRREI